MGNASSRSASLNEPLRKTNSVVYHKNGSDDNDSRLLDSGINDVHTLETTTGGGMLDSSSTMMSSSSSSDSHHIVGGGDKDPLISQHM